MVRKEEMETLVAEMEEELPTAVWVEIPPSGPLPNQARFYTGSSKEWVFTLCTFEIESQGFPPGSRGCDGVGRKTGAIVHFGKKLKQMAVELVEKTGGVA